MEKWVPLAIGMLTGLCVYEVLGGAIAHNIGGRVRVRVAWCRQRGLRSTVLDGARRIGEVIPREVATWKPVRSCAEELGRLLRTHASCVNGAQAVCTESRLSGMGDGEERRCQRADRMGKAGLFYSLGTSPAVLDSPTCLGLTWMISMASGALGGVVALSPLGCMVGFVGSWGMLFASAARHRRAEVREIEAAMPEAFAALAIALGSGHSLARGMQFVGSHAQDPVKTEFLRVSFAIECGVPAVLALDELLVRLPAPGLGLVSLALKVSQRTGAPLRGLLADAADLVGERIELGRQLEVKTAQARMSARIVALMPVVMVAALTLVSSDFRAGLSMPLGAGSVVVALMLNVTAWGIIHHMMEVDVA